MNEYNKKLFLLDEPVSRGHATFHGGILFEDEYQSILEILGSVADNSCWWFSTIVDNLLLVLVAELV